MQTALDAYAPRLADAYAVADLEALQAYAREHDVTDARVRAVLDGYLELAPLPLRDRLTAILEGYSVEKEIAGLEKRIGDLLAEGRVIRPTVKSIEVESVEVWSHVNAFATTVEVWDLRVYAAGTDVVLSDTVDQRNRVKYQLQRSDQSWHVLFRQLDASFE